MKSADAFGNGTHLRARESLSPFNRAMRYLWQAMLAAVSVLLVSCFDPQGGWHRGNLVSEEWDVEPFTEIVTRDGWDLILQQGTEYAMTVEAEERRIDHLIVEVRDGVLDIRSDNEIIYNGISRIYLTFRELNSVKASGGSDVSAETLIKSGDFELELSGGSDLERLGLDAERVSGKFSGGSDIRIDFESIREIDITASGGSDIELNEISGESCELELGGGSDAVLRGSIDALSVKASGGSDIEASGLDMIDCKMDLSGSSDAETGFVETLELDLSGGSDFSCHGSPRIIRMDICSSCDMRID